MTTHDEQFTRDSAWHSGAAILATVLVLILTGCAAEKKESAQGAAQKSASAETEDHPLALFLGGDLGLIDYAQLKLQNQCLAKAGYPQNLNTMQGAPRPAFENLIITARTFGPTTEQEARRIGFGIDQRAEPPSVVSYDSNYDRAMEDCSKSAWQQLGPDAQKTYLEYYALGNKVSGPLMTTISSRLDPKLSPQMLACMRGKGYQVDDEQAFLKKPRPDLFGVRFGTLDPGAASSWRPSKAPGTIQVGPESPARQYHATPEEGALAVTWLKCRQETGMAQQQMTVAVAVQKELVAKHETSFDELNPQIKRVAKQSATLIGSR